MLQITAGSVFAYLEYAVFADKELLMVSHYDRSSMAVNALCANVGLRMETARIILDGRIVASIADSFETSCYTSRVVMGKEMVYHGLIINSNVKYKYLIIPEDQLEEEIYSYFMTQFELPLLKEWTLYIYQTALENNVMSEAEVEVIGDYPFRDKVSIIHCTMTNDMLKKIVSEGLQQQRIRIAKTEQEPLEIEELDDYFERYGHTLVDNLEKILQPLSPLKDKVDELTFISKRLYPQQAAIINGAMERLTQGNYTFLIESMGCGKTLQGMGIIDGWFVKQYLKKHQDITVQEVYQDMNAIKYRIIIMCPPHLVEKWAQSIREEVPYARVEIISELVQLVKLKKKGKKAVGKEYFILSKDAGKLSYSYRPIPHQMKTKKIGIPICKECETDFEFGEACKCGSKEMIIKRENQRETGLICPECGELLLPASGRVVDEDGKYRILQPEDFATQNVENHNCRCCGELLWAPACKTIDTRILFRKPKEKRKKWRKISHYSNRAKKSRKSVWVMNGREDIYKEKNHIDDDEMEELESCGPRRFSMTKYIKKYLKGYFDMAIFDEVQDYKAGGSAQGYSMHDLIKASKKQICLTGTIAGGYASDLFYTLYRLDPNKMLKKGYEYGSKGERKFVEKYGTLETVYDIEENDTEYHMLSRGKIVVPTRCLPGISVLIFTEFLLGTALFLDISDLGKYLPKFYENIIMVPLEKEIEREYFRVRSELKDYMKKEKRGKLLLGSFLQFSLSYTDLPYNRPPIVSPATGEKVCEPLDLSALVADDKLLNKEKALVKLINEEQRQKRNCFIYCEFTGEGEEVISYRLKKVLEKNCNFEANEVTVLESSNPPAVKREEWMHEHAAKGTKIFITNAKCVSTGLDFAFQYQGNFYNYPTIIFYQTGYDMIKIWQASRRSYRLNQSEECRVFYMISERTIQPDVVEMIADKEVATSSIQGQFSLEGLATMARGADPRVILAQSVADKSEQKERGLKKMMNTINERNNQGKEIAVYEKMLIFSELTGLSTVPDCSELFSDYDYVSGDDVLELLYMNNPDIEEVQSKVDIIEELPNQIEELTEINPKVEENVELSLLLDFIL